MATAVGNPKAHEETTAPEIWEQMEHRVDAIVCGAPDERWGQTVAAIIQPRVGHEPPSLESVQAHCRTSIAGYKLPRRLYVVDKVERSPSGKPDYTWATAIVTADDGAASTSATT